MLEDKILNHLDYFDDIEYIANIHSSVSFEEISQVVRGLLNSTDAETVGLTCGFIRDSVNYAHGYPPLEAFSAKLPGSQIIKDLEALLFSASCHMPGSASYTLGKICSYDSVSALEKAFYKWRDSHPLLLPSLVGEMLWLGADNQWELLSSMLESQVYVTRWAVLGLLEGISDEPGDERFQIREKCISQLRQDSNILVKTEAEYEYQLLTLRCQQQTISNSEYKKQRKALDQQYKPALSFFAVKLTFNNDLCLRKAQSYSITELIQFIENRPEISEQAS